MAGEGERHSTLLRGHSQLPAANGYVSPREGSPLPARTSARRHVEKRTLGLADHDVEYGVMPPSTIPNASSLSGMISKAQNMPPGHKVSIRDRIKCYQWTWFTMTMATGGVANVLASIPFKAEWLTVIGLIFFFMNLTLFMTNCILISLRFCWRPGSFIASFTDQFESLFVPAIVVSLATIFITICEYGIPNAGPWLMSTMRIMFWLYVAVSTIASSGMYLILWSTQVFPIHTMTPVWVFPAYPLLLTAPFGSTLISAASSTGQLGAINQVAIALACVTVQGTGFLISFMIMAAFLYRLMTQKLPRDTQRPGIFVSIGPAGFTVAGIVGLGNQVKTIVPSDFVGADHAIIILQLLSQMMGLWLWGLSMWFFLVSVGSLFKYLKPENRAKMPFQMTWFSFVFPNTALVTATVQLGKTFDNNALEVLACALAACLVVVWIIVFACMLRSLWRRQILWPKDAD